MPGTLRTTELQTGYVLTTTCDLERGASEPGSEITAVKTHHLIISRRGLPVQRTFPFHVGSETVTDCT